MQTKRINIALFIILSFSVFVFLYSASFFDISAAGTVLECGPCTPGGTIECTSGICCSCGVCGGIGFTCNQICLNNACRGGGVTCTLDVDTCITSPSDCPTGTNFYVDEGCQQRRIVQGPRQSCCCLYYCATQPRNPTPGPDVPIEPFPTAIDFSTPAGIVSLITTGFQLFFGVVAIMAVIIAIRSALLLTKAGDPDAQLQARKNMTNAIVGLAICGIGILVLQILINILGLHNFDQVFNAISPFLSGGN